MHTQLKALCEVKRKLEFVTRRKTLSRYHFVSLKNRGKHEKKHVKKGKRVKSSFLVVFFALSLSLEICLFLLPKRPSLIKKSRINL